MINQEIYQGIKYALSKKQSLKDAMMSFYNAGYQKKDIEEAARKVQIEEYEAKYNTSVGGTQQTSTKEEGVDKKGFLSNLFDKKKKAETISQEKKEPVKEVDLLEEIDNQFSKPKKQINNKIEEKKQIKPLFQKENKISSLNVSAKHFDPEKVKQRISNYEDLKRPKKDWLTIFLIILLLVLIGAFVAIFLFKQEMLNFFSNLF